VEQDSVIFVPERSSIIVKNKSKFVSAIMKIQFTVYEAIRS